MNATRLIIALVSLALVVAVSVWEWRTQRTPGPLHPSHASVVKLRDADGCAKCHGSPSTSMAEACLDCHEPIKAQIASRRGLHGSNPDQDLILRCAQCHDEHSGARVALVTDRSFASAGFDDPRAFDHSRVSEFKLTGRHANLTCQQCHPAANASWIAAGETRFIGLTQDCARCHKDPHEGAFGNACASCHGQSQKFKPAADFKHTDKFLLAGGHADKACDKCHEKAGPTSVKALFQQTFSVRACVACHKDVHEGTFGPDCNACHGTVKPFKQAPDFKHIAAFPLTGGHENLACKVCHEQSGPTSVASRTMASLKATSLPIRACGECHASPHRTAFITVIAASNQLSPQASCVACHLPKQKSFLSPVAQMTPQQHAAAGFSLERPHDKTKCVDCHKEMGTRQALAKGTDLPQRFASLFPEIDQNACEKCHKDPHGGQFASGVTQGKCIACHAPTHFAPNNFGLEHHEKTAFPLTGSHRAVSCAACHKKPQDGVIPFVSTSTACNACHVDVHGGKFDAPPKPAVVNDRTGCARCHGTTAFKEVTWTAQDHSTWTGYPLNGAHATAQCVQCHKPLPRADEHGRTFGTSLKTCVECHADPHAGQFATQNVTDCARCHLDSGTFTQTTFDHQRDSQFKLDAQHIKLACSACHKPLDISADLKVVRYKPLGTRCQDCHDSRTLRGKEGQ